MFDNVLFLFYANGVAFVSFRMDWLIVVNDPNDPNLLLMRWQLFRNLELC